MTETHLVPRLMGGAIPPLLDVPSQDNSTFFCHLGNLSDALSDPSDLCLYLKYADISETAVIYFQTDCSF
jgi:hypothetical protein